MTTQLPVNAVLFDLDGTLLNTAPDLAAAANAVLATHGKPSKKQLSYSAGCTNRMIATAFNIDNNHPQFSLYRQQLIQSYQMQIARHTRLFPGIKDSLQLLKEKNVPWGIVTSKFFWLAQQLLDHLQLEFQPDCLIGRETLPFQKPHPLPLDYACRILGVSPAHCIYVGDAASDIVAAKSANMRSIAAAYGYLSATESVENWGADHIIYRPEALATYLRACL